MRVRIKIHFYSFAKKHYLLYNNLDEEWERLEINMSENTFELIKKVTELKGISGAEYEIRKFLSEELSKYTQDVRADGLGSIFGVKQNKDIKAPRVMIAGHMDEIGFMVKHIRENGMIEVVSVGGWSTQVISAQRFTLQTKEGDYTVVSSSIPPHLLKGRTTKEVNAEDVLFDAGFESQAEAYELGVRPGDAIVPESETVRLANQNRILGKAVDNRYSIAVILEMLQELEGEELPNTLIAGASVQEEVGLRGIQGAVRKFKPDVFFAVDASPANDISGDSNAQGKLGDGFLVRVQDPGMITLRGMREFIADTAEKEEIPHQYFFSKGGTDAGSAHLRGEGLPATTIGMPARYIHTHQSIFDIRDYNAAKDILLAIVRNLDTETLERITARN